MRAHLLVPLAWFSLVACGGAQGSPDLAPAPPAQYLGAATDEALQRLLALPLEDAGDAWTISSPVPEATLSGNEPFTLSVQRRVTARAERVDRPICVPHASKPVRSAWAAFSRFIQPVSLAHAHGAPFNGRGFYFVVSDGAARPQLRIFTERTSLTVDSAKVAALRALPQPLNLTVLSAVFEENEVVSGGGPFSLGSVRFRVE